MKLKYLAAAITFFVAPATAQVVPNAPQDVSAIKAFEQANAEQSNASVLAQAYAADAVMLDYMTPEELAHSKQLEHQSAAPLPGTIGEKEPPPRIRQTVVIGRNNPDPVWEMDHPNAGGYDDPGAESRGLADPPTYRSGPTFYYRGRGGGGGGGSQGPLPGAPRVGGDWPSAPNYGPKQMR